MRILCLHWISAHPQTYPRFIIPRTIVVHACFLIILLGIEEIRRVPCIIPFFNEHFAEWNILNVLYHLTVKIGNIAGTTQMIGMVVELHPLILFGIVEVVGNSSCLQHLRSCCFR